MSLVGFKAQNHRQQVSKRGAKPRRDGRHQELIESRLRDGLYRARPRPLRVEFLKGRLRFIKHGHDKVEPNQRPPFGCCLLIWSSSQEQESA